MEFRPVEPNYSWGRAVGETGKHGETGSPFDNFANAPKKYVLLKRDRCTLADN
jgi:hypothetical protein